HMFYTTIPGLIITLVVYGIIGINYKDGAIDTASIQQTIVALEDSFVISPWLLFIPVAVIGLVIAKVPAIPALVVGALLGTLSQVFIQGDSWATAISSLQSGFVIETGNDMVDSLFNRGGLDSMMYTVSMTLVAMTFGGILEYSGMLQSIMNQILKLAKTAGSLIASTILACFTTNATCSEQYISIVVPARMFVSTYKQKGLHSKNLSRALEDGGTLTSVFIPWNTCGVFILGTLGVGAMEYAPYAVLNYIVPIVSIIYAFTGFTIQKLTESEIAEMHKQETLEAQEVAANLK
ncbi:Na+/H+ antiporter NhaC, partial [Butyricicoccus sp. 1XD8-22]